MIEETPEQREDLESWNSNYLCTSELTEVIKDVKNKLLELLQERGIGAIQSEHVISCFNKAVNGIRFEAIRQLDARIEDHINDVEPSDDYVSWDSIEDNGYIHEDNLGEVIQERIDEGDFDDHFSSECPACHCPNSLQDISKIHDAGVKDRFKLGFYCKRCCRNFSIKVA